MSAFAIRISKPIKSVEERMATITLGFVVLKFDSVVDFVVE